MKKLILLFCFSTVLFNANAQPQKIDSLKALLSKATEPMERFKLLEAINEGYYSYGTGENNVANHLEMLRIALQQKDDSLIAISYNKVGDYYLFEVGDYNTAVDYFFKGIPYAERAGNKRWLSSLYIDIAVSYSLFPNPQEQLNYLRKAELSLPAPSHPEYEYMLLQLKSNYALCYLMFHQPKTALPYLDAANQICLRNGFPIFSFYVTACYANLHEQMKDTALAAVYFKKALVQEAAINFIFPKIVFKRFYISFLINNSNFQEAKSQAQDLLAMGEKADNTYYQFAAMGYLKTVYDKQTKYDSAYFYSKKELALKDTIFNGEKLNKIHAIAFNEEVRAAEVKDQRNQNLQFALIALGIISLLILYLLLSRSFITNTKLIEFFGVVALLIVFEFLNLLLHPFLERVTNHSPILMLFALVCIAALLVPLHHKVEKWTTAKLVQKNKKIRLAAAKKTIEELEKKQNN